MFLPFSISDLRLLRFPVITWGLVLLNIWIFIQFQQLPQAARQRVAFEYGFLPCRVAQLMTGEPLKLPVEQHFAAPDGREFTVERVLVVPYQPRETMFSWFSYMFMHGGWMHLLGNMWFLWLFGRYLEDYLGHTCFLLFYLGGGLLAALAHWSVMPGSLVPVVGASGAVAAVLGAFTVLHPAVRVKTLVFLLVYFTDIELPAFILLMLWFVGQVASGLLVSGGAYQNGVAWWAHVGGFVTGMWLMMFLIRRQDLYPKERPSLPEG